MIDSPEISSGLTVVCILCAWLCTREREIICSKYVDGFSFELVQVDEFV